MPSAFIAMPFAQKFYSIYKVIREACEELGVTTIRIDEVWAREDIYQQIEEEILKANFIIADFTGDRMLEVPNPNVVHEAAFAHTHKKYILLLAQDHKCLPFDWRTRPAIIYQQTEEGLAYLKERLVIGIRALKQKKDFNTPHPSTLGYSYSAPTSMPPQMPTAPVSMAPSPMAYAQPQSTPMGFAPVQSQVQAGGNAFSEIQELLLARQADSQEIISPSSDLPEGFQDRDGKIICCIDASEMIRITADKFSMGGEEDEDQMPVHEVYLSDYLIDIYPVTNLQFMKFMEAGGYSNQNYWTAKGWNWRCKKNIEVPKFFDNQLLNQPEAPVVGVSWYEAMAYTAWSRKHLPSEAQWEYAARGKDNRPYPWGKKKPSKTLANYRKVAKGPTAPGSFEKGVSPFGCYDMAGNVWEWCYDWYDEEYYEDSPLCNPIGPDEKEEKVCRGGSWTYGPDNLKTFSRFWGKPDLRDRGYGFRCARIL